MQNGTAIHASNGIQNGGHTNGIENGFHDGLKNGIQNGWHSNGIQNGFQDGVLKNGVHNGLENEVSKNGIQNGCHSNGIQNGFQDGVLKNGVHNGLENEDSKNENGGLLKTQNGSYSTPFMKLMNDVINPNKSKEEIAEAYDIWANEYDQVVSQYAQGRMTTAGREFESLFKDKDVRILDVGAGTGLVSIELRKRGFHNIDALDPSESMVKVALDQNLYHKWYKAYLTKERLPIPDNQYDAGIGVGVFSDGQAREDCLEEILRILKPGGQFMVVSGEHYMEQPYMANFEPAIKKLEEEGKLRRKIRKIFPGYSTMDQGNINGLIIVFQKPKI